MQKIIAQATSLFFHPLLVPTYAILLLLNLPTHHFMVLPPKYRYLIALLVFLTTFVLPSLIFVIMKRFNALKSLQMHERRERVLPLIIVAVFFYTTYFLLKQNEHNSIITLFMLGATMLVLLSLIVNYFTKISIHTASWGGLAGALAGFSLNFNVDVMPWLYVVVLLAGVVGAARLLLNAHTAFQVYLGFLVGSITQLLLFFLI